ncbi:hypothetical protein T484DRAFT_1953502 [Baffinella frigidus]|nr:hypothetical protein T484DRAFT_1953502 [Cryptophyta sp. CCMP2293]
MTLHVVFDAHFTTSRFMKRSAINTPSSSTICSKTDDPFSRIRVFIVTRRMSCPGFRSSSVNAFMKGPPFPACPSAALRPDDVENILGKPLRQQSRRNTVASDSPRRANISCTSANRSSCPRSPPPSSSPPSTASLGTRKILPPISTPCPMNASKHAAPLPDTDSAKRWMASFVSWSPLPQTISTFQLSLISVVANRFAS